VTTAADPSRRALYEAIAALRRVEWSAQAGMKCPACSRPKAYGIHVCSCPLNLAFKAALKAGVAEVPRSGVNTPAPGPFSLSEIPLEEWARWKWMEVTTGGDRARQFLRGLERTPDEVRDALEAYASLKEEHPALFEQGSARP
jgi:hypothetical protein